LQTHYVGFVLTRLISALNICLFDNFDFIKIIFLGIHGQVVKVDNFKVLATLHQGFETCRGDFAVFHARKLSSLLLKRQWFYSGAHLCLRYAQKGTLELPPPVNLENCQMTHSVLV
jgi:hypothetical protein